MLVAPGINTSESNPAERMHPCVRICEVLLMDDRGSIYWNSFLPIFFDRMNAAMRRHMTDEVSPYGLTSSHAVYLIALVLNGPMTQMELSDFLDMDPANTHRVIKVLYDKGMVYDDRINQTSRNYRIHLTEIGKKLGNQVMDSTSTWMDKAMEDIPREDIYNMRNNLITILKRIEPDIDNYMHSPYTNPFYTYLLTNPLVDGEKYHVRIRDVGKE